MAKQCTRRRPTDDRVLAEIEAELEHSAETAMDDVGMLDQSASNILPRSVSSSVPKIIIDRANPQ